MEHMPEPTADTESKPASMSAPDGTKTEPFIGKELKSSSYGLSDQVCEAATPCVTEAVLVEFKGME